MADFSPTQVEIQNTLDPLENTFVLMDSVNTSYKATVTSGGALLVTGSAGTFQVLDNSTANLGVDLGVILAGYDGANYQFISVNSSGELKIGTLPAVTQGTSPWVVSGTVTANAGTGPWPVTDNSGSLTVDNSGTFAVQAAQSGTWTVQPGNTANTTPWLVDVNDRSTRDLGRVRVWDLTNFMPTMDVVGRAGFQKITDGTNVAGVDASNHLFVAGKSAVGVAPTGNPLSVSGVDGGGLKRTLLTDTTGKIQQNLAQWIGSTAPTVGQKTMADSIPVTISLDQTAINVTTTPGPPPVGTDSALISGQVVSGGANLVAIHKTAYVEPTSTGQRSIASSSASDTSAGTGARTVKITYMKNAMDAFYTETLTLNGTTGVNTVATDIRFIEKMEVITVGATGSPVGTISLYTAINKGGTVIGTIAPSDNQTFWAHHYIASGKAFFLATMAGGVNIKEPGVLWGSVRNPLDSTSATRIATPKLVLSSAVSSSTLVASYATPINILNGPANFTLFVDASGNDTYFCGFAYLEQNA